jgi:hypothetical protein
VQRPVLDAPQARGYSRYYDCMVSLSFGRLAAR